MKKIVLTLAALAVGASAYAAEIAGKSYSVTADFTYASEYVFRGARFANASFQPSIEIAASGAYVGVWSNQSLQSGETDEIDYYAGYSFPISGDWKIDAGVTRYTYDTPAGAGNGDADSTEAYVGLTGGNFSGFTPSFYAYYDFDYDNVTLQGSVGYSVALKKLGTSLDFSATLGWVNPDDSFNGVTRKSIYYGAGVTVPYKLADNATVTGGVQYANTDVRALENDIWYYTLGLSIGF